jgi:hypothetical protein
VPQFLGLLPVSQERNRDRQKGKNTTQIMIADALRETGTLVLVLATLYSLFEKSDATCA